MSQQQFEIYEQDLAKIAFSYYTGGDLRGQSEIRDCQYFCLLYRINHLFPLFMHLYNSIASDVTLFKHCKVVCTENNNNNIELT